MGMVAECDLCKEAQDQSMDVLEVKVYSSASREQPREVHGAMICPECQKALGLGEFIHKFKSMGAVDIVQRVRQQQMAEQRLQQLNQPIDGPVPVDRDLARNALNAR